MGHMKSSRLLSLAALVAAFVLSPSAARADRLSDKEVKELLETLDHSRDRFEDQLDGKLKDSIVRGPQGEVRVDRHLDDLQENVKNLRERYTGGYAASAEVATLLRQGSAIHRFMRSQGAGLKGASEWDHLAGDLTKLAEAYGTTFPLEGDAPVRRVSDGEAAAAAENVAKQSDALKKAFNNDKSLAKPDKEKIKSALDQFKKQANTVKSRVSDGKPASAEMRLLNSSSAAIVEFASSRQLPPAAGEPWSAIQGGMVTLRQAFGMAP
jgi:hypothetical protein